MGTRSIVSLKQDDIIKGIYVHFDGYPEYMGKVLSENYNKFEQK